MSETTLVSQRKISPIMSLPFECELSFENETYCTEVGEEMDGPIKRNTHGRKGIYEKKRVVIKEGFLLKHSKTTLKRGTYRNFKLYKDALFYSRLKDETQSNLIKIVGASIAERGTKNTSHSFSVITESRTLILSAENRRDMEDWIRRMRSCAEKRIDKEDLCVTQTLSGLHNWCLATFSRPTFCSKCRESVNSGVTCEVCGMCAHQNCANGIELACKWTTRESIERDGVKLSKNSLYQPHQWLEGNLHNNSKCILCKKSCGSKKSLQDWSCIWCRSCCHEGCKQKVDKTCNLGKHGNLILPATAAGQDACEMNWRIIDTSFHFNPFLAYVNSRSGDNQGVKFVRRLRSMLNPLQVIDLGVNTPEPALEVYKVFERFTILACGGDGTVGWILQCLDKYKLHKKVSTCVVPLGTGNDLSRVLGWGAACNDDSKLEGILDDMQKSSVRQLDRWSVSKRPVCIPSLGMRKAKGDGITPVRQVRTEIGFKEAARSITPDFNEYPQSGRLSLRRRSSTGEMDFQFALRLRTIKKSVSLVHLNIPEGISGNSQVEFGFEESNNLSDQFQVSEKSDFTDSEYSNRLSSLSSSSHEEEVDVNQKTASLIIKLFSDIRNDYPNPEKMDLASASSVCSLLQTLINCYLESMKKWMPPHEVDLNITANKANAIHTELPVLIKAIEKLNRKKAKNSITENEILIRSGCFVLIAHDTEINHLEGADKAHYISIIFGMLLKATQATDYQMFKVMFEKKLKEDVDKTEWKNDLMELTDITTMNNYIGIGLDAKIALDFHNLREEHPEQCKTRGQNKMWYGIFTGRQMISQEFKHLSQRVILECDGVEIDLPQLQGIVLLNIPSYMAGTNFWGTDKESGAFNAPSIDDKKLEVIAVMGTGHMAESKMFGVQRHRLAQAEYIKLTILGAHKVPIQVDGEAWLQDPGVILIRHKNKASMIVRHKKKDISKFSDPLAITRNLTPSYDKVERHTSNTSLSLIDLVEAVEALLEILKNLIQSKKAQFQESVDKDLIVVFQKVSFTFLQAYGPDGLVITQGMHQIQGDIIASAKTLLKETMLYLAISDTPDEEKRTIHEALQPVIKQVKGQMQ